jgi:hypothetical protein
MPGAGFWLLMVSLPGGLSDSLPIAGWMSGSMSGAVRVTARLMMIPPSGLYRLVVSGSGRGCA